MKLVQGNVLRASGDASQVFWRNMFGSVQEAHARVGAATPEDLRFSVDLKRSDAYGRVRARVSWEGAGSVVHGRDALGRELARLSAGWAHRPQDL
jgi:endonuclease YncB( thermonuclease family)